MDVKITFDRYNVIEADKINDVKVVMVKGEKGDVGYPTDAQVETAVDEWLTAHPEVTTTVQDGSITEAKLANDVKGMFDEKADAIIKTSSGDIASFTDGGNGLLVKSLNVNITPKQSGSGDPSPSNVRSISGYSEVNVNVFDVNILDVSKLTEDAGNYILNDSGVQVADSGSSYYLEKIGVMPNTEYYFYGGAPINGMQRIYFFDGNDNFISRSGASNYSRALTTPQNCSYIRIQFKRDTLNKDTWGVNYPSTETEYHSYQGNTYPISLGQTVYGGTLEVMSGKLTITRILESMQNRGWTLVDGLWQGTIPNTWKVGESGYAVASDIISDIYKNGSLKDVKELGTATLALRGTNLYIKDTNYSTATAFNNSLSGHYFCVLLKTPTEIQLTPTQVKTLLGNNNIFADSGSVEVEYRADTTLAYNELLSLIASL